MNDTRHSPSPVLVDAATRLAERAGIAPNAAWEAAVAQWAETRDAPQRLAAILALTDAPAFDPLPAEPEA